MNQRIGYARVSTDDQNLDLQREALKKLGVTLLGAFKGYQLKPGHLNCYRATK